MSSYICDKEESQVYTVIDSCERITETPARKAFTRQTGQALIALGTFFKHIPPFNEAIDKNTGDTLISIGRKLKK
ncbi:MAG: hypothetical protein HC797_05295 [Anaerolineales bacterium]|nr:hypothetical protein [Anaerolineales bacterium]